MSRTDEDLNAAADASAALMDSGVLRIYSGTPPATVNDALSGNTVISEHNYNATAFAAAVAGVATANAISSATAQATETATFYRRFKSGGTTPVRQGTVSAIGDGGDLQMSSTSVTSGQTVNIQSHTITEQ